MAGTFSRPVLGRLRNLEPSPPVQRFEWERSVNLIHVAVDDSTRLANVEVSVDGQKPTVNGFLSRAVAWCNAQGV